jgi:hypothetical protein
LHVLVLFPLQKSVGGEFLDLECYQIAEKTVLISMFVVELRIGVSL